MVQKISLTVSKSHYLGPMWIVVFYTCISGESLSIRTPNFFIFSFFPFLHPGFFGDFTYQADFELKEHPRPNRLRRAFTSNLDHLGHGPFSDCWPTLPNGSLGPCVDPMYSWGRLLFLPLDLELGWCMPINYILISFVLLC